MFDPSISKKNEERFDLESNWNFVNGKSMPEIPISLQIFLNEVRFRIKLETFWRRKAGQKFLYLRELSSTEFDLESNSNFLNGKSRPEILISLQTSPNEILYGIKLKIFEWKKQVANSYISANSLQRNSI